MINEHDIQAFKDEIWDSLSEEERQVKFKTDKETGETVMELGDVFSAYTKKMAHLLAQKCDKAWYFDAANLIRQTAGIPISVMSDMELSMKSHPEDDPE